MKRTTIYLDPELEMLLKSEMLRQHRPMAEIVREAVEAYVTREPRNPPPGAGAFASGHADTAEEADRVLEDSGFGEPATAAVRRKARESGRRSTAPKRARR